jgi:hypothetical protein
MDSGNEIKREDSITALKQSLHELGEISIMIDSYDNIFSDFDPSPFSERTLSDDFITQSKKISKNKSGKKIGLNLLLPKDKRNDADEKIIIKRLHSYFKGVQQELIFEVSKVNKRGFYFSITGIILMLAASYISYLDAQKFLTHLLLVMFEPAGWFLLWSGLDHLVYSSKETKKDLDFYSKMTKCEIKFTTY